MHRASLGRLAVCLYPFHTAGGLRLQGHQPGLPSYRVSLSAADVDRMRQQGTCRLCGEVGEDIWHWLFECRVGPERARVADAIWDGADAVLRAFATGIRRLHDARPGEYPAAHFMAGCSVATAQWAVYRVLLAQPFGVRHLPAEGVSATLLNAAQAMDLPAPPPHRLARHADRWLGWADRTLHKFAAAVARDTASVQLGHDAGR